MASPKLQAARKPVNLEAPDFAPTVNDLLGAKPIDPTPEQVEELHDLAKRAKDDKKQPAPPPVSPAVPGRYRVALQDAPVRMVDEKGNAYMQDHYDTLHVASEWEAVCAFAKHNGIPIARDALTGEQRLASIHKPKVELLPSQPTAG